MSQPSRSTARKEVRIFWFTDYGVTVVSNGVMVHQDLLESDPSLIRAFAPPSIKEFLYGREHLDEAAEILRNTCRSPVCGHKRHHLPRAKTAQKPYRYCAAVHRSKIRLPSEVCT
jgi:hypothetical protein